MWHIVLHCLSLAHIVAAQHTLLEAGWSIQSSSKAKNSGAEISKAGFDITDWHSIKAVPATVLGALADIGVYKDLYYDQNFQAVPVEPFLPTWWYRTQFTIPASEVGQLGSCETIPDTDTVEDQYKVENADTAQKCCELCRSDERCKFACHTKGVCYLKDTTSPTRVSKKGVTLVAPSKEPPQPYKGKYVRLLFKGINYRANVWLNGHLVANNTTIVGTFRYFDLDITPYAAQVNILAVEVTRPRNSLVGAQLSTHVEQGGIDPRCPDASAPCKDLAITWVDWAPTPADFNMGLWRGVELGITGPVSIAHPLINTTLIDNGASVSVYVDASNRGSSKLSGRLEGSIGCIRLTCGPVAIEGGATVQVECQPLRVNTSMLWWPWQMGPATLHKMTLGFHVDGVGGNSASPSDTMTIRVGLRQVTKEIDERSNALFRINGKPILIRGGGWSPDLLQRMTPERHVQELEYVRHLGLNTIRLEGKLQDDHLFQLADQMGILMLPGWCCCDSWQAWGEWEDEQFLVAKESLRSQVKRLRASASVLGFIYSSDQTPPENVEKLFLQVFEDERWPNPTVSSAHWDSSPVTGPSGVKMTGPYAWQGPGFWSDGNATTHNRGGAFGFNTETSPGASVMPLESLQRTTPESKLWPISEAWYDHCGASTGAFHTLNHFTPGLSGRLGAPESAEDFTEKAQLMNYESHRAMFEAYSAAKYTATGVVQWMLNNPFPSHVWHLYDWYLNPAGAYFGAKKANEPLHILYLYGSGSVWIVNSEYAAVHGVVARAEARCINGTVLYTHTVPVETVAADGTRQLFSIPSSVFDDHSTILLRLTLDGADGERVSTNVYWLAAQMDKVDWNSCSFFQCKTIKYANFADLVDLSPPELTHTLHVAKLDEEWSLANVTLRSSDSSSLAFFVRARLLNPSGGDVLPVLWNDNYVTLFAGESQVLSARFRTVDGPCASVVVKPFARSSLSQMLV